MENKDAILSDLYALRTGLSVISQYKDEVCEVQSQTDSNVYNSLKPIYDEIMNRSDHWNYPWIKRDSQKHNLLQGTSKSKSEDVYSYKITDFDKLRGIHSVEFEETLRSDDFKESYEKDRKDHQNDILKEIKWTKSKSMLSVIRAIIGTAFSLLGIIAIEIVVLVLPAQGGILVGGAAFAILGIILVISGLISFTEYMSYNRRWKQTLSTVNEQTTQLPLSINSTLTQINLTRSQANAKIQPIQNASNSIYKTLVQKYGSFLDPRDWQYLDLIIYYMETNRALDLRDALLQLDRERQTQQIVNAVQEATYMICKTIQTEMSSLRSTIRSGFSSLQNSINNGFAQLQAIGNAQLAVAMQQLSETQLSNSLIQKSNVTSEQLMNDVHYMRTKLLY